MSLQVLLIKIKYWFSFGYKFEEKRIVVCDGRLSASHCLHMTINYYMYCSTTTPSLALGPISNDYYMRIERYMYIPRSRFTVRLVFWGTCEQFTSHLRLLLAFDRHILCDR